MLLALAACTPEPPAGDADKSATDSGGSSSLTAPELSIDPPVLIFGGVEVGSTFAATLELVSSGTEALMITAINAPDAPFTVDSALVLPLTLAPDESAEVSVSFSPTEAGNFSSAIQFVSDDPEGVDEVPMEGSASVVERPIAVCGVTPGTVEPILEPAAWSGEGSYDPTGLAITDYDWNLVSVPVGSRATLADGEAVIPGFLPDVPGTFVAQLVVTNELGQVSEPCETTLESVTLFQLWIYIHWATAADDMDLHLVRPGGELETEGDCYYANCIGTLPDWGVEGDIADDPELIADDVKGIGPEVIRVFTPEPGDFEIYVQDYPGSSFLGPNDVSIYVYIAGELAWSDVRDFSSAEGHYENFASVSFPSGVVTAR